MAKLKDFGWAFLSLVIGFSILVGFAAAANAPNPPNIRDGIVYVVVTAFIFGWRYRRAGQKPPSA